MRTACWPLLLTLSLSGAHADDTQVQRLEIGRKGIYEAAITTRKEDKDLPGGVFATVERATFVEFTSTVPARPGTSFGYEYLVVGAPKGAPALLRVVTIYPEPGLHDPRSGTTTRRSEVFITKSIGTTNLNGYRMDRDWEAVPGTWTFQIWAGDRKLSEQTFTAVRP